jgi:RNA polymerase sigma factor (sigma-70 family)
MPSDKPTALWRTIRHLVRPDLKEWSDGQLLDRFAQSRDEIAFAALMRRHGALVLSVGRRYLGNLHDAEDVYQATFLILARNAGRVRKRAALGSWLYGVAYRLAMKARTRAARRRSSERRAAELAKLHVESGLNELQMILDEEVQHLTEKYRGPFVLCCLENKSRHEAARELGLEEGTLASRIDRARKQLQKRLTRRGISLAAALTASSISSTVAAVPSRLAEDTLQASLTYLAGSTANISSGALALAQGVVMGKAKIVFVLVTTAVLAIGGARWAEFKGIASAGQSRAAGPAGSAPGTNPVASALNSDDRADATAEAKPRADLHGDPLPDGAVARLGTLRFRHHGETAALAFTPDGTSLVANTRSFVMVWNAKTGKERLRIPRPLWYGHPGMSDGMAITPDGNTLALPDYSGKFNLAVDEDETKIGLWDLRSGKKVRSLALPGDMGKLGQLNCIAYSSDGKFLAASYTKDGKAVLFDLDTGGVKTLFGDGNKDVRKRSAFYLLAISPDSKFIAFDVHRENSHAVQLWDVTGKFIRTLEEMADNHISEFAFAPDGKCAAIGITGRIVLVDPVTGKKQREWVENKMDHVGHMAFTVDGRRLVSVGGDGKIWVWDVHSGETVRKLDGRMSIGRSMALSNDSKTVALGAVGHTIRLWDLESGNELFTDYVGHDSQINCLAFSPDGATLVSGGDYQQTFLWDTARWQRQAVLPISSRSVAFSPGGRMLATVSNNSSTVRMWDVVSATEESVVTMPYAKDKQPAAARDWKDVKAAAVSSDGRRLVTLDYDRNRQERYRLRHWDLATGTLAQTHSVPYDSSNVVLASDCNMVFAVVQRQVAVYDVRTRRERNLGGWDADSMLHISPSPDAGVLAVGLWHGQLSYKSKQEHPVLHLVEVLTGKEIGRASGLQGCQGPIAWSLDGRFVAYQDCGGDPYLRTIENTVRVLDSATGAELARFGNYDSAASALAFSPDGKLLVAGTSNTTILVWDLAKALGKREPAPLSKDRLEECWHDLSAPSAADAHRAIGVLAGAPGQSIPFLQGRLKPAVVADPAKVSRWLADLDNETFSVRQAATRELEKLGEQVVEPLQKALKGHVSLETGRRLEQISSNVFNTQSPEVLRSVRAIMALERIGSDEARNVLEALARGASGARDTVEARASLERMKARSAPQPIAEKT